MREEPPGLRSGLNREGLSGPRTSPPRRSCGGTLSDAVVFAGKLGRQGLGGTGAACQKLALSRSRFRKLFPKLLRNSVLGFPAGCPHSLVGEKLGNFPERPGEKGWPRREERRLTRRRCREPGRWVQSLRVSGRRGEPRWSRGEEGGEDTRARGVVSLVTL